MLIQVIAPTVAGSHMSMLRPEVPRLASDRKLGKPGEVSECQKAYTLNLTCP